MLGKCLIFTMKTLLKVLLIVLPGGRGRQRGRGHPPQTRGGSRELACLPQSLNRSPSWPDDPDPPWVPNHLSRRRREQLLRRRSRGDGRSGAVLRLYLDYARFNGSLNSANDDSTACCVFQCPKGDHHIHKDELRKVWKECQEESFWYRGTLLHPLHSSLMLVFFVALKDPPQLQVRGHVVVALVYFFLLRFTIPLCWKKQGRAHQSPPCSLNFVFTFSLEILPGASGRPHSESQLRLS